MQSDIPSNSSGVVYYMRQQITPAVEAIRGIIPVCPR